MERLIGDIFKRQGKEVQKGPPDYAARRNNLIKLRKSVLKFQSEINKALYLDLHKSEFEAYATETGFVLQEISFHLKHLKRWMKPKRVATPLTSFPASSKITCEPKGRVLILSPWNYPFQLLVAPLVGALSAGNRVILKPSEISQNTAAVLERLIKETFPPETVALFNGGVETARALLQLPFDHIFFTGSSRTGKIVMQEAAKNMTPVTLELGGKSPCVVDKDVNLRLAARRIVWGKLLNAGQTCIAPDYLLVHKEIKEPLIDALKEQIVQAFGTDIGSNAEYPRIISGANVERLKSLIEGAHIVFGGEYDVEKRFFAPTILDNVTFDMPVMQQEIFGPVLPVLAFENYDEVIQAVNGRPKPLAFYLFTDNVKLQKRLIGMIPAGGVTVNDTVMHIGSPRLPFGGIGNSGTGKYRGKFSFDTFSNVKPVVKRGKWPDVPVRYAPYGNKIKILKYIMR